MTPKPKAEETLKACPFCGSDAHKGDRYAEPLDTNPDNVKFLQYIWCFCGAQGKACPTIEKAIEAWNRRTPAKDEGEKKRFEFDGEGIWDNERNCTIARIWVNDANEKEPGAYTLLDDGVGAKELTKLANHYPCNKGGRDGLGKAYDAWHKECQELKPTAPADGEEKELNEIRNHTS